MDVHTYGYIRVSTKDQNEDRQIIAMKQFGVEDRFSYIDRQSGKEFNRPAYKRTIRQQRKAEKRMRNLR